MSDRQSKILRVVQVAAGNFLEMYDFTIFGYYAAAIGRAFFPNDIEYVSLMATFMTFAMGFLMRPLGALFLGPYVDRQGRRKGLLLTLAIMAIGTLTIALVPGYETWGFVAPLIVVAGRLCQGLSAGVELGGVSVYLSEIATPGHKGFYVSWQSASQQVAVGFAALLGVLLTSVLKPDEMTAWGWRVPMILGCMIIPLLFLLRRNLQETEDFLARAAHRPTTGQIYRTIAANWRTILLGVFMVSISNAAFYAITAYTPTYGTKVLHLSAFDAMTVTLCVALSNFVFVPLGGAISDRVGRAPVMVAAAILMLGTAYPVMSWLTAEPSFGRMLALELWLSILYSHYNGAMIVFITEIVPVEVRTSGFSLAYATSQAIFGGFTPLVCTYLINQTGDAAMPGAWLAAVAVVALSATLATALRLRSARPVIA